MDQGRGLNAAEVSAKEPEFCAYATYLCLLDLLKLDLLYIPFPFLDTLQLYIANIRLSGSYTIQFMVVNQCHMIRCSVSTRTK